MKNNTSKILLILAYVLMLCAVAAAFALFGVQTVRVSRAQEEIGQLQQQLEEAGQQNEQLEEENAGLKAAGEENQKTITALEQQLETVSEQYAQTQAALEEATRYTLDVRQEEAGTVVELSEINPEALEQYFVSLKIEEGDKVYQRIIGKSYVKNDDIGLDDLRYMKVLHYNFDHKVQVGELIVNKALAEDYQEIFLELFENEYEIQSMYLIDNYWTGDGLSSDSASIDANNTSAFCYRRVAGGSGLSNHALGRAIDLNPQQNPYVTFDSKGNPKWSHDNADDYIDRDTGLPHVITHDDLAYKVFKAHDFDWGGDWRTLKDYQHFDKEK